MAHCLLVGSLAHTAHLFDCSLLLALLALNRLLSRAHTHSRTCGKVRYSMLGHLAVLSHSGGVEYNAMVLKTIAHYGSNAGKEAIHR